jgi:hypothetical protein
MSELVERTGAGQMSDNDHLTKPMLSAAMDEIINLRARIEALEAALREVVSVTGRMPDDKVSKYIYDVAKGALDKDDGK